MADSLIHQLSGEDIATTSARREHRVVGLTSATEDDSKLELLLNLAPRLAERILGEILVVDAQMQKSELTKRLSGAKNASIGQKSLIYPTTCHRLNVLPMCQNPGGRKFDDSWMDELRERWFLTLLDMPSLENADAVALAGRCDGVYLAVRLGRTPRRSVVQASRAIQYAGGQLLGCLVIA
jgi:Mrp family chromosome partitioning ATPase